MEPMTLGSPGSPTSPGSAASAFLPQFLMGESVHSPHPTSPTKTPRQANPIQGTPRALNLSNASPAVERRSRPVQINQVEKPGGPPIRGLFDTLESTTVPTASTPTYTSLASQSLNQSSMLPPLTNVRNFDENAGCGDNWITVFGFPPSVASSVLAQFAQLGQLLEHKFPPKGNWVHLHYYSKMEARRALTYHGKVLGGTTMIGVIPCRDQGVIKGSVANGNLESPVYFNAASTVTSPANCGSPWTGDKSFASPRGRPLNRSFLRDNEVLSQQNAPVRNDGFVSRTIDYIFGW